MIPGVTLFARTARTGPPVEAEFETFLRAGYSDPVRCTMRSTLGDWLACGLLERERDAFVHRYDDTSVTVLLSGYVSDVVGPPLLSAVADPAAKVAQSYLAGGTSTFNALRGSFTGVVLDRRNDIAVVFNDRQGSRPMFRAGDLEGGFYMAPESRALSRLHDAWRAPDRVAVGEYLVRGCCYGSATLFKAVRKVEQAVTMRIGDGRIEQHVYWAPTFTGDHPGAHGTLLDELDSLLARSTERLLSALPEPVLLLSGGVDSRLMLGYLLRHGQQIPSFSYHVQPSTGEDHVIAGRLAELTGIPHDAYAIDINGFVANAVTETMACDGRVQICDAPSNRWDHIGGHHQAMFIGDESFGWKGNPANSEQALDIVGWWNIDAAPRVRDCLLPQSVHLIEQGIAETLRGLTDGARSSNLIGLKDELYYTQRVANLLNGFSARRLSVCEQARPLLDEDLVEFFTRVPHELRLDKQLVRDLLARRFPALAGVPYSRKTSVPWDEAVFLKLVAERPELKRFIIDNLSTGLCEPLGALFDRPRLEALALAYLEGRKLPPYRDDLWARIPGGWRFARERADKVGTLRSLLRIMQLNIFLSRP